MKLELKHLAGYLPYELKYKDIPEGFDGVRILCIKTFGWCLRHGKPILRPLSDLTKEIEVNGEKFVPIKVLDNSFRPLSQDLNIYRFLTADLEIDIETEDYSQVISLMDGFNIVQKLLEWHFDIYGLIENGLAIDINTL